MFEITLFITLYVMVARMNRKQDCQTKKEKEKYIFTYKKKTKERATVREKELERYGIRI